MCQADIEFAEERQEERNNPFINILPWEERNSVKRNLVLFPLIRCSWFPWVQYKLSAKVLCDSHWHRKSICGKPPQPSRACSGSLKLQPAQKAWSLLWHEELDQHGAHQTEMFVAHMSNPLEMSVIDLGLILLYLSPCSAFSPKNNSHMNHIKVTNYCSGVQSLRERKR